LGKARAMDKKKLGEKAICPRCGGSGFIEIDDGGLLPRAVRCACMVKRQREEACAAKIVETLGPRWNLLTLDNYFPGNSDKNRLAVRAIRNYVAKWPRLAPQGAGFLLYGESGAGKTHLASACVIAILQNYPDTNALVVSVPSLLRRERLRFSESSGREKDIISAAANIDLLLLDDIGAEYRRTAYENKEGSDLPRGLNWLEEQLYLILDFRVQRRMPTILTSNYSPRQLKKLFSERLQRRLLEASTGIAMKIEMVPAQLRPDAKRRNAIYEEIFSGGDGDGRD